MKKLILLSFLLSFGVSAADDCSFDSPCDGELGITKTVKADVTSDCDLSDPSCPLPEGFVNYSKENKDIYYLCISVNPRVRRYGIAITQSQFLSALQSFNRCRQASGIFGFFCRRPQCMSVGV